MKVVKTFSLSTELAEWLSTQENQSRVVTEALELYRKTEAGESIQDLINRVLEEMQELKAHGVSFVPVERSEDSENSEADDIMWKAFGKF
jgi:hypothetical protein